MASELQMIAAAAAMGISAIGYGLSMNGGIAAYMGTIAEKPEAMSKGIIGLALPETSLVLGFVTAIMILAA